MWIISYDTPYYPWIEKFDTYEKAKIQYDKLKELEFDNNDCVFLSEVREYTKSEKYKIK